MATAAAVLLSLQVTQEGWAAHAPAKPPPPVDVLTAQGARGPGFIFVAPAGQVATYAYGPEILDRRGHVVWFHPAPAGQQVLDFRTQTYHGKPVLTWWQGTGAGRLCRGIDRIFDDRYRPMTTVKAGNGLSADCHEFLITRRDTALITVYATGKADLTSIGGPARQTVVNGVVQEIDIATGKVLLQWSSADHVGFGESRQPLPASAATPWDWFHLNAAHVDTDGNLLIDARNTWATYKVDRADGHVIWRLGGDKSNFRLRAARGQTLNSKQEIFAWQHDPEALGGGLYTWFDNESSGVGRNPLNHSRVVTVKVDERDHVATLISSIAQPEGLSAESQGNAQTTRSHSVFVGWGSLPYFSQFDSSGQLLFQARFPEGVHTYRAYLLPWHNARPMR